MRILTILATAAALLAVAGCGSDGSNLVPSAPAPAQRDTRSLATPPPEPEPQPVFRWRVYSIQDDGGAWDFVQPSQDNETFYVRENMLDKNHNPFSSHIGVSVSVSVPNMPEETAPDRVEVDMSRIPVGWTMSPGWVAPVNVFMSEPKVERDSHRIWWSVRVGGYGQVRITAHYADLSETRAIILPGVNGKNVITKNWALSGRPTATMPATCDGSIGEEARSFTANLWSEWSLPIPVDVVDNWPVWDDFWEVDIGDVLEQISDFAEQIEDALGFPLIRAGEVISEREARPSRPRETQRFHVGFRLPAPEGYDGPIIFGTAYAFPASGYASWINAGMDSGQLEALAHELEHLLGFNHPGEDFGVTMVYPEKHPHRPGEPYWLDSTREWAEWDASRFTSSKQLRDLYCIFWQQWEDDR